MKKSTTVYYVRFDGHKPGMIGRRQTAHSADNRGGMTRDTTTPETEQESKETISGAPGRIMSGTYTFKDVARLFQISESRLRYWDKSGFISPSGRVGRRRAYTFQDLIGIRSVKTLLENGISLQRTRRILKKLKEAIPRSSHPLSKIRIMADAKTVVVTDVEREFEADTGQLLLDFDVGSFEKEVVSQLPDKADEERAMSAYEWYLEGCALDENPDTTAYAEEAYHKAIHMDPSLSNAYTNLGNLLYRKGASDDARALYQKAIEVDANQPEAHYNLGFLEFEARRFKEASRCFAKAVELDTTFADAHFNLAITLFRLGDTKQASAQLEIYLNLEPTGPWADVARQRLQELGQ
jgi:DNA-binding transcriptional MerR regulator